MPRTRGRVYRSIMRKIHVLGLALFAVFALSAVAASSALAVSKYLLNGAEITSTITTETESNSEGLLLEDMNATGKPDILCSGFFDGTIAAGGVKDTIEAVLTLTKELLQGGHAANSDLIECEAHSTCTNPVDVEAINLPWATEVVLSGTTFVDLIFSSGAGTPGYIVDCNTIIGLVEDTCTGNTGAILANATGGVLGEFSESNEAITVPANCTQGGEKQGLLQADGLTTSASGTLSLSE